MSKRYGGAALVLAALLSVGRAVLTGSFPMKGIPKGVGGAIAQVSHGIWLWMMPVAGVAILLLLGSLLRRLVLAVQRRRPGPVTIVGVTNGTDKDTGRDCVKALIEEHLARTKLVPTAGPPLAGRLKLDTAVKATSLKELHWVVQVLDVLRDSFAVKSGHQVSVTVHNGEHLHRKERRWGLTLRITRLPEAEVERVETVWATDREEAAERAAYLIHQHVLGHASIIRRTPLWDRWEHQDGESLRLFRRGRDLQEQAGSDNGTVLTKALEAYQEASNREPQNGLVRLQLAGVQEQLQNHLDALQQCLTLTTMWPGFFAARYRLAVILGEIRHWLDQFRSVLESDGDHPAGVTLECLLTQLWEAERWEGRRTPPRSWTVKDQTERFLQNPSREDIVQFFLERSECQLTLLLDELSTRRMVLRRMATLSPWHRRLEEQHTWATLAEKQHMLRRALKIAQIIVRCQQRGAFGIRERREVHALTRRSLGRRAGWMAHYNAACFYSLAMGEPPTADPTASAVEEWSQASENDADAALQELRRVIRDPRRELATSWLASDHDLDNLRRHPLWVPYGKYFGIDRPSSAPQLAAAA